MKGDFDGIPYVLGLAHVVWLLIVRRLRFWLEVPQRLTLTRHPHPTTGCAAPRASSSGAVRPPIGIGGPVIPIAWLDDVVLLHRRYGS